MNPTQCFEEAKRKTERLVDSVCHLIFLHEANQFIVYSERLPQQVTSKRAAAAFNIFRAASFEHELLKLCTIWDRAKRDRESIPSVIALLEKFNLGAMLAQENHVSEVANAESRLTEAKAKAKKVDDSSELASIREHRNVHIAHFLTADPESITKMNDARFGSEGKLLRETIEIVDALHLSLNGAGFLWDEARADAQESSRELWSNCTFVIPRRG